MNVTKKKTLPLLLLAGCLAGIMAFATRSTVVASGGGLTATTR